MNIDQFIEKKRSYVKKLLEENQLNANILYSKQL